MRTLTAVTFLALCTVTSAAFAAAGSKVDTLDTSAAMTEGRSAGMVMSGNAHAVRADAVQWRRVKGSVVPEANYANAGDSVRSQANTVDIFGRS